MMRAEEELMVTTLLKGEGLREARGGRNDSAHTRALAEAVILQCMEDMWDPEYAEESREFFQSEGFVIWAETACLNLPQQMKLVRIITGNELPYFNKGSREREFANGSENTGC